MSFTILQDTPTIIPLADYAKTTGWTLEDGVAKHEACNDGAINVKGSTLSPVTGQNYTVAYEITNLSGGSIRLRIGTTQGVLRTTNGQYVETLVAGGSNPLVSFFATGALWLRTIDVKSSVPNVATKKRNTIVFSEQTAKWSTFFSFTSDYGLSLFKDLFTFKAGKMYKHDPSITPRNNIYGVQYDTMVNLPFNAGKGQSKTYESISYESNMLFITTSNGVRTSLGQVSSLISQDFLREHLDDGINQVDIYSEEGIYMASFVQEGSNQVDGSNMKGTYITVELISTETGVLDLKNVMVNSVPSYIGGR